MTFVAAIMAFLLFGWTAPDGAWAMIPRDVPVSVIAARYASSATADGTLVAEYDYDPYGRLIRETGPKAASCPFRYSTKYRDPDLGLLYYGHRWYDAAALKWLIPDPIGERGGDNLTAFCDGDPINSVDPLGLATMEFDLDYDPSTDQVLVVLRRCPWWKAQMNLSNWTDVPDTRRWRPATTRESAHWRRVKSGDVVGARLTALSEARLEDGYHEMLRYQGALAASTATAPAVAGASLLVKSFVASSAYAAAYEAGGIPTGDVSGERYALTVAVGTTGGVVIGGTTRAIGSFVSEIKRMPLQATLRDCRVGQWHATSLSPSPNAAKSAVVPKQITVIGSRTDTLAAKGWPGHNVLDVPTWTAKGNIKWLDSAIRRGDEIYLATDPAKHAAILDGLPTRPFSAFTDLELPYLQWRGYVQEGVRMVPKAP